MLKIFTVYDSKAGYHQTPFFMVSTGAAQRGFITILNDPQAPQCLYPADFTLFEIGTYNEETGEILPHDTMINLGNGLHMKGKYQVTPNHQIPVEQPMEQP